MKTCILVNDSTNEKTEFFVDQMSVTVKIYEHNQCVDQYVLDIATAESLKSHILNTTDSKETL